MLCKWRYESGGKRDLRIDWLRGLAMCCVIVNHSKLSSVLSWFSYERFWTVTAAEVFVVLSGIVVGMVYGGKLKRGDWRGAVAGLGAFVIHVYAVMLIAHNPMTQGLWRNTLAQVTAILAIAAMLNGMQQWPFTRARRTPAPQPVAA